MSRIYCGDFPEAGCCGSCHADADDYDYSLLGVDDPDTGEEVGQVCCQVSIWCDKNPDAVRKAIARESDHD